jgi:anthranilate synthase/aminodeoxychorismate synthase-like glutamine amidotransferase
MILLIDNYDSFTFNLYQMIEIGGAHCQVVRNDQITIAEIENLKPDKIVLSPGPGNPMSAGISLSVIQHFAGKIPIFGVCLGHQAIGQAFGGKVVKAKKAMHGKRSKISHDGRGVFNGLLHPIMATRYHSLIVERESLPDCLEITCQTDDGVIMGLRHRFLPIESVQFHPESIATENGQLMIDTITQKVGA